MMIALAGFEVAMLAANSSGSMSFRTADNTMAKVLKMLIVPGVVFGWRVTGCVTFLWAGRTLSYRMIEDSRMLAFEQVRRLHAG